MEQAPGGSWRIAVNGPSPLLECALWIRAAERLDVPADDLVPGPLVIDPVPPPSTGEVDPELGAQWLRWWRSLLDPVGVPPFYPDGELPEPAYDTPDPLGLAGLTKLGAVVAHRHQEAFVWSAGRPLYGSGRLEGEAVRSVEVELGRKLRPIDLEFILVPVHDETVRHIHGHRYLVPEQVYQGPQWAPWLRSLLRRAG